MGSLFVVLLGVVLVGGVIAVIVTIVLALSTGVEQWAKWQEHKRQVALKISQANIDYLVDPEKFRRQQEAILNGLEETERVLSGQEDAA